MSEAKETASGSSDEIRCSGAEGLPRGDGFGVQGTAKRIARELCRRYCIMELRGLFLHEQWRETTVEQVAKAIEQILQHEDTKSSS